MSAQPCKECRRRPKSPGRHRCVTCQLRHEPIGDQVAAAARRLGMVPEELRVKRSAKILALAPSGTSWCAACQSFRDEADFGKKATTCRACTSAKTHGATIAKTYGLDATAYEKLLELQGGKCAICRARPISKRLAVDHNHTTGAVRGLLCSRCNHDLLGSAWDSMAIAVALWHYLNTPPTSGLWMPPEAQARLEPVDGQRPSNALDSLAGIVGPSGAAISLAPVVGAAAAGNGEAPAIPIGSEKIPGKPGLWRYYVEDDAPPPF